MPVWCAQHSYITTISYTDNANNIKINLLYWHLKTIPTDMVSLIKFPKILEELEKNFNLNPYILYATVLSLWRFVVYFKWHLVI